MPRFNIHDSDQRTAGFTRAKVKVLTLAAATLSLLLGGAYAVNVLRDFQNDVLEAFSLTDGQVIRLDLDTSPGKNALVGITIEGSPYTLDLQPKSIRASGFALQAQLADGSYETLDAATARTLRGTLRGSDGSRVVGSMLETGLAAKLVMGDGRVYFIEPLVSKMAGEHLGNMHVLYRQEDVMDHGGICGLNAFEGAGHVHDGVGDANGGNAAIVRHDPQAIQLGPQQEHQFPKGGALQIAELAVDADFEYFSDYGTQQATLDRMELVINIMNDQYESEVGITHVISGAIVRTSEPDPYTSTNPETLLNQFRNHWLANQGAIPRDVAHLFTGKELNGSVIGIAFTIGGICSTDGYCLSQSDFGGGLACATDLSAHELGHLWDAFHCSCPSHTMNASITCTNTFHPTLTVPQIINFRDSVGCLETGGATPPPNDQFDNTIIIVDPDFSVFGTNLNATTQASEQQLENTGSTVWWFFDADTSGTVTIDTFGSDYDTQLHIYTGFEMGFPNLVPVANNDDSGGGLQSQVSFAVNAGQCYEIRVGGFRPTGQSGDGAEGNIDLNGSFVPGGPTTDQLSQSLDETTITQFNSVSCNAGGIHTGNSYYRSFNLADQGIIGDFTVESVCLGVEVSAENINGSGSNNDGFVPIQVNFYWTTPLAGIVHNGVTGPTGMNASVNALVPGDGSVDLSVFEIPVSGVTIPDSAINVVVEVFTPGSDSVNGMGVSVANADSFFVGSNAGGQTGPTYIAATGCGINTPTNLATIGFPNMHMVLIVKEAEPGTGCNNPLGDINGDEVVSLLDVSPFVAVLTSGLFQCEADVNEDGVVSLLDVAAFVQILTGG